MRDPLLLTPGPLTTSAAVKQAMGRDLGSRDIELIELNRRLCRRLLTLAGATEHHVCVPLQGSGTFVVEAMVGTFVPPDGGLLVLVNGAYGQRIARVAQVMGRPTRTLEWPEDTPVDPARVAEALTPDVTHVAVVHCETTTGLLNPVEAVGSVTR